MKLIIIASIATLIIGFGGGYLVAENKAPTGFHEMPDGSTMSDTMAGMTSKLEEKTGDNFDKAFIEEMIVHHEGAVSMAQQALQKAQHAEIKEMAQDIIDTQTQEITTMRNWMQSWYGI